MDQLLKRIKESTGLNDLALAKLTLNLCYDRATVEKKAIAIAEISNAALVYYTYHGCHLEIVTSPSLKKNFQRLTPGTKVRYEVKTKDGKILDDMTHHGVIPEKAAIFYMSGTPCIHVDFGKGPEAYDAIGLIVEE